MSKVSVKLNSFDLNRQVNFVGGEGIVRGVRFEGGIWKYLVEMPQGQAPTFGRVGAETTVLLSETELCAA